jgi:hypothetical protein
MGSPVQLVSTLVQRSLLQVASRNRARATPMLQADTLMSGNSAILASTPSWRGRKSALRISFAISCSHFLQAGAPESALSATRSLWSSYAGDALNVCLKVGESIRQKAVEIQQRRVVRFVSICYQGPRNREENDMAKAIARRKRVVRRNWTRTEVKELRQHSKDRTRVKTISRALKRTPGALRQKARLLGIPLGHRRTKK